MLSTNKGEATVGTDPEKLTVLHHAHQVLILAQVVHSEKNGQANAGEHHWDREPTEEVVVKPQSPEET